MPDNFAETVRRNLHPEYNSLPLAEALIAVDKVLAERDRYRLAWQSARRRAEAWRGDYVTVATDLHRRDEQWMGRAYHDRIVAALKREHKAALGRSRLGKRLAEAEATIARIREYCDLTPVLPAQAVVQLLDGASVAEVIIARSSLGSPEVQAIAALTPPEDVAEIMRRVRELEATEPTFGAPGPGDPDWNSPEDSGYDLPEDFRAGPGGEQ